MTDLEACDDAWESYPSQDNEGYVPDRGGFKAGWFAALEWERSRVKPSCPTCEELRAALIKEQAKVKILRTSQIDENGCWIWTGFLARGGYAQMEYQGVTRAAHRVSFEVFNAPFDEELSLDHLCRVPKCVNPKHLDPVDHRTNTLRGIGPTAKNHRKILCKRGHALHQRAQTNTRECRVCKADSARRIRAKKRELAKGHVKNE